MTLRVTLVAAAGDAWARLVHAEIVDGRPFIGDAWAARLPSASSSTFSTEVTTVPDAGHCVGGTADMCTGRPVPDAGCSSACAVCRGRVVYIVEV